ncbi:MAG: glycine cleavage system protein H [Verrucomicrobiae bacterium]|nr:glycine cleavage system protein H [Verrucomicrobiae bacterium]
MPDDLEFMMGKFAARVPTDRRYLANHMWLRPQGDALRFGLTAYAVRLLLEIYFLEWSVAEGDPVKQKAEIGAVESAKATAAIYAPATGTIARLNPAALADPGVINRDCYGKGWLFEIAGVSDGAMEPRQYIEFLAQSWEKAQALLKKQAK